MTKPLIDGMRALKMANFNCPNVFVCSGWIEKIGQSPALWFGMLLSYLSDSSLNELYLFCIVQCKSWDVQIVIIFVVYFPK